jgi:hypothetical protein
LAWRKILPICATCSHWWNFLKLYLVTQRIWWPLPHWQPPIL